MTFGTILLGDPFNVNLSAKTLVKGIPSLIWRVGYRSLPSGLIGKTQDFYDRVQERVMSSDVTQVTRKTFAGLKQYLDEIVDSIVAEIGQSEHGVVTDFTKTMVGNDDLEQAFVNVGLQLRGYSVDVAHYRNLGKMVLGIPVVPTVASGVVSAAKVPQGLLNYAGVDSNSIRNLPSNSFGAMTQLGQQTVQTMMDPASVVNKVSNLGSYVPGMSYMPSMSSSLYPSTEVEAN